MQKIELMTRKGCHLCDDVKAGLLRLQLKHPFELIEVDIDLREDTRLLYDQEVPVVLLDGSKVAKFRLDEAQLLRRLQGARA